MKKPLLAFFALASTLAACGPCQEAPLPEQLKKAVRQAHAAPPCDAAIPMEWPASWPVPTGAKSGREFKLLFYPLEGSPGLPLKLYAPLGEAALDADNGAVSSCRRLPGKPRLLSGRRWPRRAAGLGINEFERKASRLYALTERAAALYAAGKTPAPKDVQALKDYVELFLEMAEPALLGDYRRMNPDFWDWLAKSGAPAPFAPAPAR